MKPHAVTKPRRHARRLLVRLVLVLVWSAVALATVVPAARAVGLPFVDLPTPSSIAGDAFDSVSRAIVGLISSAVGTLMNEIIRVSDTVAAPQVGSANGWFTASYKRSMGVSLWLMAIAALIAVTHAGLRGKPGEVAATILVRVPGAIVAMMLATVAVQLSLGLVDAMTAYTFRGSVDDIQKFLHDVGVVFTTVQGPSGSVADGSSLAPGLVLIMGLLLILAQLMILAVLIVRAALVYVVTLFLPLVLAVQVWPATRHMTRKALELLAVAIFAKYAIFACFALGTAATTDILKPDAKPKAAASASADPAAGKTPPPVQSAIVGLGVMTVAAFSPMLLLSIVPGIAGSFGAPWPGGHAQNGAMGGVRSPVQAMRSTLSAVQTVRGGTAGGRSRGTSGSQGASAARRDTSRSNGTGGTASGSGGGNGGQRSVAGVPSHGSSRPATSASADQSTAHAPQERGAARNIPANASAAGAGAATAAGASAARGAKQSAGDSAEALTAQRDGPHVVDGSRGPHSRDPSVAGGAERSRQLELFGPGEGGDGFARVQTRQPLGLETT